MRGSAITLVAVVSVVLLSAVLSTVARGAGGQSQAAFVRYLAKRPPLLLPSGFSFTGAAGYTRPAEPCRCETIPFNAVGLVQVGTRGVEHWELIQYTVFASAADAKQVMVGPDPANPAFSVWRLKQLNSQSLPDPKISARHIDGYGLSVIVDARAHRHAPASWHDTGLTEANALVGNVIVNVATPSSTMNQEHGDRVSALRLLRSAVAHLRRAQLSFVTG